MTTVIVINTASKTFTDSNPHLVVYCLLGGGGFLYWHWFPYLPMMVEIYRQAARDMTNDKMTMYLFENILQY